MLTASEPVAPDRVPRPPILNALTSIRFFAAMQVALFHMVRPFSLWGPLQGVISVGYVGVSFFFVLSGFILTYSHAAEYEAGKGSARQFWIARFARIYPVYFVSMLFAGYAGAGFFHNRIHILAYIADLLLVQSWSMRMVNFFHITAWSLSIEAFFYLLFPFLLLRLRPSTAAKAFYAVVGFWLLAMLFPAIAVVVAPDGAWDTAVNTPGSMFAFRIKRIPVFAVPEFLAGISLGWLFLRFRPAARYSSRLAITGIISFVVVLVLSPHIPPIMMHNGLFIPIYAMIILGLSEENWLSRALSVRPLVLLGEASFALYLIHLMFDDWVRYRFGVAHDMPAAVWKLAIVIPVSIALHLYVERPARRAILKRFAAKRMTSSTLVSAS